MAKKTTQVGKWKGMTFGSRSALKILMGLVILGLAGGFFLLMSRSETPARSKAAPAGTAVRRETRPTLSPDLFVGKVARAHEVAQRIPDVLDQLYCYCECDKHKSHKSLLSCYTDGHAVT